MMTTQRVTFSREYQVGDDWHEVGFAVTVHCTPYRAGCSHLPNGDPGYPSEPAEAEIDDDSIVEETTGWAVCLDLTDDERALIEEEALELCFDGETAAVYRHNNDGTDSWRREYE